MPHRNVIDFYPIENVSIASNITSYGLKEYQPVLHLLTHSFHHFWSPIYMFVLSSLLVFTRLDSLINLCVGDNLWYVVILYLHESQDCTFLKIIHERNIEVVAFYETRSSLFHGLCYGFNHLFLFKIKVNFTMLWTRIRLFGVTI